MTSTTSRSLPRVIADGPLAANILELLAGKVECLPWSSADVDGTPADAVYTYGHPRTDGPLLDRLRGVKVISNYGGTRAGNRANYIAGATYLHLKEFDKAIRFLKDFDGNGASQVQSRAFLMIGHAYAEQNKQGDALEYYKKAANVNRKDEGITADALYMAATYADATGKNDEAKKLFNELKNDFPLYNSVRSGEVDKYLARLGQFK